MNLNPLLEKHRSYSWSASVIKFFFCDSGLKVKLENSKLASKAVRLHIESAHTTKYQFVARFSTFVLIRRNQRPSLSVCFLLFNRTESDSRNNLRITKPLP